MLPDALKLLANYSKGISRSRAVIVAFAVGSAKGSSEEAVGWGRFMGGPALKCALGAGLFSGRGSFYFRASPNGLAIRPAPRSPNASKLSEWAVKALSRPVA